MVCRINFLCNQVEWDFDPFDFFCMKKLFNVMVRKCEIWQVFTQFPSDMLFEFGCVNLELKIINGKEKFPLFGSSVCSKWI